MEQARINQATQGVMRKCFARIICNQQHWKLSRYSGSFICKEKRSSVQHSHKCSNLLQVNHLQTTQQAQPIYIPHNNYLQENILQIQKIQIITSYFPTTSPTSPSLSKYDLYNINNDIKSMTAMTYKHQYDMKTLNKHISDMITKVTNTSSKIDNHEEQLTEISSKISKYEDRLKKWAPKKHRYSPCHSISQKFRPNYQLMKTPWQTEHHQHHQIWNTNKRTWRDNKHKNWHKYWWYQRCRI